MAPLADPDLQAFLAGVRQCMAQAATAGPLAASRAAGQEAGGKGPAARAGRSGFRGVTKHKRTQRFEAHCWREKQVYLGAYDNPQHAACAHDLAVLRLKGEEGAAADGLNFPPSHYKELLPTLLHMPTEELVSGLRTLSKALTAARLGQPARSLSRAASEGMASSLSGRGGSASSSGMGSEGAASKRGGRKRKLSAPVASMPDLGALQQLCQQQAQQQEQQRGVAHERQQGLPPRPPLGRPIHARLQPGRSQSTDQEASSRPSPDPAAGCSGPSSPPTSSTPVRPSPSYPPQSRVGAVPFGAGLQPRQPAGPWNIAGSAPLQAAAAMHRSRSSPAMAGTSLVGPPAPDIPGRASPVRYTSAFVPWAAQPADPALDQLFALPSRPLREPLPALEQGGGTPLLSPLVASRAVRELASISTALAAHPGSLPGG